MEPTRMGQVERGELWTATDCPRLSASSPRRSILGRLLGGTTGRTCREMRGEGETVGKKRTFCKIGCEVLAKLRKMDARDGAGVRICVLG